MKQLSSNTSIKTSIKTTLYLIFNFLFQFFQTSQTLIRKQREINSISLFNYLYNVKVVFELYRYNRRLLQVNCKLFLYFQHFSWYSLCTEGLSPLQETKPKLFFTFFMHFKISCHPNMCYQTHLLSAQLRSHLLSSLIRYPTSAAIETFAIKPHLLSGQFAISILSFI